MVKQALRVSDAKCIRALAIGLMLHLGAATAGISHDSFAILQGDAVRGESIVTSRQLGLCLLCHSAPGSDPRVQGNLAPNLAGAGSRWSAAQLRERIANARAINPESIMPILRQHKRTQPGGASLGGPALAERTTNRGCGGLPGNPAGINQRCYP